MSSSNKKYRIHFFLLIVIIVLGLLAYLQSGWDLVQEGFFQGIKILWRELPLLAAAFLTAGLLQSLLKKEFISRWLGTGAGLKGILLACLGGALIPGGPYAYYPIASALLKSGAGMGVLIAFVMAKNLWSITRLPLEFAILGSTITIRRYLLTFIIPPLVGILAESIFGKRIKNIRENIDL